MVCGVTFIMFMTGAVGALLHPKTGGIRNGTKTEHMVAVQFSREGAWLAGRTRLGCLHGNIDNRDSLYYL